MILSNIITMCCLFLFWRVDDPRVPITLFRIKLPIVLVTKSNLHVVVVDIKSVRRVNWPSELVG